ncbi:MAG TPA: hypothetical protein VE760_05380 [Acidimicrobiales bacterium]|nr:hypothetical protein [Acidimicrobiales bacterium]
MHEPAAAEDFGDHDALEVRLIQPYQARKAYVCPGCNQDIAAGLCHLVVVPRDAPDLRRHWHRPCWAQRATRRPGRA